MGAQDNGFIQERDVVAGTRVGVLIVIPVFLAAVFLVVLVLFSDAILVSVLCLDKGWILVWSFGLLFLLLFWLVLSLLSWLLFWSLLLCSWKPGARIGSCMVVSVRLSYDCGCFFLRLMQHR